jgi:hypothetical protein
MARFATTDPSLSSLAADRRRSISGCSSKCQEEENCQESSC